MNKFLKGAVACTAIVPCLMGLTACGDDKKNEITNEGAYNAVMSNVNNMLGKITDIETPGKEFQLNINVSLNQNVYINSIKDAESSISANARAVIGARHGQSNKELFGNIGLVDGQGAFTSLLSAYAVDDVDENATQDMDEFVAVADINAGNWEEYKAEGTIYVLDQGNYVPADDTFDEAKTYYMQNADLIHLYMTSNVGMLRSFELLTEEPADWETDYTLYYTMRHVYRPKKASAEYVSGQYYRNTGSTYELVEGEQPADWAEGEYYVQIEKYEKVEQAEAGSEPKFAEDTYYIQTGFDINDLFKDAEVEFEFPEGDIYATLDLVDAENSMTPSTPGAEGMDIDMMLQMIQNMDYNTFIQNVVGDDSVNVSAEKTSNGEFILKMSDEGTTMKFVAKSNGGIRLEVNDTERIDEGMYGITEFIIDIDLEDEIDESYIPTNLADYGDEPIDLMEIIAGFMGGQG